MRLPYLEMGRAGMDLLLQGIGPNDGAQVEVAVGARSNAGEEEGDATGVERAPCAVVGAPEFKPVLIPMPLVERGSVRQIR